MRGQRHAPAALYPWEKPGIHCTGGWVGPKAGLDMCGKSPPPTGIRSPDRPACSQSLYWLSYPAHLSSNAYILNYSTVFCFCKSILRSCLMPYSFCCFIVPLYMVHYYFLSLYPNPFFLLLLLLLLQLSLHNVCALFIEIWSVLVGSVTTQLTFRHRASCILGQAFHYSPENAFYIFNEQIYFIIWYLLDSGSLI